MNRLVVVFSVLLCTHGVFAADTPSYGPIPAWVNPTEVPALPAGPDTAPFRQLLQDQQLNFLPESQETFFESVVQIQTSKGLQAMSTFQVPWRPDTDVLTIHKVQIRRGDQVIDALAGGEKFTLLRRENNLEYSVLDGILTAAFQPSDLRVGDTVDIAYTLKRTDPILAGAAEEIAGGWIQGPVSRVHMRARWPRSSAVRWRVTDDLQGLKEQTDGDHKEVTYTADNVEPPVQPRGAPLRFLVTRLVEFSGSKSWPDVSKRLAPLFARASTLSRDSPLRAEVTRISAVAHNPIDRAEAALRLAEDDVRYVFLGMNQGGIVPAQADLTWERRFGDCKAKTVLLIALLRELGIDAEPVAVNTTIGDGLDARLPMVGLFDHVIVRVHIGGQTYWLDGTRSGDRHLKDLKTPNFHWGLPLLAAGSALIRMEAIPLVVPTQDTHVQIDATAGIEAPSPMHVESIFRGDGAIAVNDRLSSLTPDGLDRALRDYWSKAYGFVDVKTVGAHFDDDSATETLTMDGSAHMGWKDHWYETNGLELGFEAHFTRDAGPNIQAPYSVAFPQYARNTEKVLLPPTKVPFTTSGGAVNQVVAGIEFKRTFSLIGTTFTAEASARSVQEEFPASEASEAQATLRAMAKDTLYIRSPNPYEETDADVVSGATGHLTTAQEYVTRGNKLLDHRDYDLAIADFNQALVLDPKADYALADRGLCFLYKDDNDKANRDWSAAEAINPKNPVVPRGRGLQAFRQHNLSLAASLLTESLQRAPDNLFSLTLRAQIDQQLGRYAEAVTDSTASLKLAPKDTRLYEIRGFAQGRLGQVEAAVADAHEVIAIVGSTESYLSAARIYASLTKWDEARQAADHAVELAPNEHTYTFRAILRQSADRPGSEQDVEAVLRLNPRSTSALYVKAQNEISDSQYAAALNSVAALIDAGGSRFEYLLLRVTAKVKAGNAPSLDQDINQAKAAATTAGQLNNLCWALATANAALDQALGACDAAIAKEPEDAAALDSRGFTLLRLGRYRESIATYDEALKLRPNIGASLYGRGLAKRAAGDADDGSGDVAAALAADKGIAERFSGYGLKP